MDEGFCGECGQPHATIAVDTDTKGHTIYVHASCEVKYARRALGWNMAEQDRRRAGSYLYDALTDKGGN